MNPYWTSHLKTEEDKQRFAAAVNGAEPVLERLAQIIGIKEKDIDYVERSQKAYENPNWAYLQAHRNGYMTAIQSIKSLINLDQQKQ